MAASRGFDEPQPARTTTASRATTAQIGRAHAELQSQSNLVCRLLLEKKKRRGDRAVGADAPPARTLASDTDGHHPPDPPRSPRRICLRAPRPLLLAVAPCGCSSRGC